MRLKPIVAAGLLAGAGLLLSGYFIGTGEPTPAEPNVSGLPSVARCFAIAINSFMLLAGNDGCTSKVLNPPIAVRVIGTKSFSGWYDSDLYRLGLNACVLMVPSTNV